VSENQRIYVAPFLKSSPTITATSPNFEEEDLAQTFSLLLSASN